MFSRTTIESSTTRPIAIVSAPRVSMLSERSPVHSTISARTTDSGMETAVTSVERTEARKSRITITAKSQAERALGGQAGDGLGDRRALVGDDGELGAGAEVLLAGPGSLSLTAWEMATALPSWSMVAITARLGLPLVRVMETRWRAPARRWRCHRGGRRPAPTALLGRLRDPQVLDLLQRGVRAADLDRAALAVLGERAGRDGRAARLQGVGERHRVEAGRGELLRRRA